MLVVEHLRPGEQSQFNYDLPSQIILSKEYLDQLLLDNFEKNKKEVILQIAVSVLHQMAHWQWFTWRYGSPFSYQAMYVPQNLMEMHLELFIRFLILFQNPNSSKSTNRIQKFSDNCLLEFTDPNYWDKLQEYHRKEG